MKRYLLTIWILGAQIFVLVANCPAQWTQVLGNDSSWWGGYVLSFAVSGHEVFAGMENDEVYLSTDDGATWSLASDTTLLGGVWSLAVVDSNVFAGTGFGLFHSSNKGRIWMPVDLGASGVIGWALAIKPAIQPAGTREIFLGSLENGIFRSTDVGASWTSIDSGLGTQGLRSLLVSGPFVYAGGGVTDVFRSSNNGTSWTTFTSGLPQNGLSHGIWALAAGGQYLYAGYDNNQVYRSSDDGEHWSWASSGLTSINIRGLAAFGSNVVAATLEHGVFLSTDNGTNWAPINDGLPDLGTWSIIVKGSNLLVGTVGNGIWRRPLKDLNIIESWRLASLPVRATDPRATMVFPEAVSWVFSYDGSSYRSADTIVNGLGYWVRIAGDSVTPAGGIPITSDTVSVAPGWNLVGSIDTTIGVGSITSIPGGLVTSEFWTYDSAYVVADSIRPGSGYWVKVNEAGQLVFSAPSSITAHSVIRITPRGELPPPAPAAQTAETGTRPISYALDQNYPNPFNPTTRISYSLPEAGRITIRVFDLLGQTVATLVDGEQGPGNHSIDWNAGGLASGIYFYRLEATSFEKTGASYTETKKLLLMK